MVSIDTYKNKEVHELSIDTTLKEKLVIARNTPQTVLFVPELIAIILYLSFYRNPANDRLSSFFWPFLIILYGLFLYKFFFNLNFIDLWGIPYRKLVYSFSLSTIITPTKEVISFSLKDLDVFVDDNKIHILLGYTQDNRKEVLIIGEWLGRLPSHHKGIDELLMHVNNIISQLKTNYG